MAIIDVTKELADILTSAFGKGWGWAALFAAAKVVRFFKKSLEIAAQQ